MVVLELKIWRWHCQSPVPCFGSCQAAKMCCNMLHGRLWLLDRAIHSLPMWLLLCSLGSIRHPVLLRQGVKMSHTFKSNFIFFEASEHSVDVFKKHTLTVNTSYFNMFRILITFRFWNCTVYPPFIWQSCLVNPRFVPSCKAFAWHQFCTAAPWRPHLSSGQLRSFEWKHGPCNMQHEFYQPYQVQIQKEKT